MCVLLRRVERRTDFCREVAVASDGRVGIEAHQLHEQVDERVFLCSGASVFRSLAVAGHAAHVADTDALGVVPLTMGSDEIDIAPLVDGAVAVDDVVVANVTPSVAHRLGRGVPTPDVGYRVVAALGCGRAMHDNFVYSPSALLQRHISLRCMGRFRFVFSLLVR